MEYIITGVQFGVWSPEDIVRQASLDLNDSGTKGNLSAFTDPRFGANRTQTCGDCRNNIENCSGHWGVIGLGCVLPNPFFITPIKNVLQCFCQKCSSLLISNEKIELDKINLMPPHERISNISHILSKSSGVCWKCKTPICEIIVKDDIKFFIRYSDEKKGAKKHVMIEYEKIYEIFRNISSEDLKTVGFNSHLLQHADYLDQSTFTNSVMTHRHENRPENFFLRNLPILPYCIRACLSQGKEIRHDTATSAYQSILKDVNNLKKAKNQKEESMAKDSIQKNIFALFKQKTEEGIQKIKSINTRLSGKEGHVRSGVESKRANFGGRSVLGSCPYLPFGMVEIPQEMTKISQIEYVCTYNIKYWNEMLEKDKLNSIKYEKIMNKIKQGRTVTVDGIEKKINKIILTQNITPYISTIQYVTRDNKKTSFKFIKALQLGDIVHRKLKTGDMCIINRQPTIRKESYNGHRIMVCPKPAGRTIKIALPVCSAYNADMDGDEVNIHVPQGPKCQAEMEELTNIETKIMTDQTSQYIINLTQSVIYGLYLLTHDNTFVTKSIFNDLCFIVDKCGRSHIAVGDKISGKLVFSLLLPPYYTRKIGVKFEGSKLIEGVIIENGILTQGQLTKKTMNRITEDLYIEYGSQVAKDYINGTNFLCNKWNTLYGYTFGIRDCLNHKGNEINKTLTDTFKQVEYIQSMPISEAAKETLIRDALDKATQIGQIISKDGMYGGYKNAMAIATHSEAKGSFVNLSYISCFLGLQTVLGQRYSAELCQGTRILPCFKFNENTPKSRGFIENNFFKGLDPTDLFFHAWSSRKGLIDTAVTTKTSGYSHRQFGKKMENAHIDKFGCVRDCDESIIDFTYGEYGFDPCENYWTGGVAFFSDLKELVERINFEWKTNAFKTPEGDSIEYVGDIPMTTFGVRQFEFIEKQLLVMGSGTEPADATKKRIMYLVRKQLNGVKIIVNKWCVETFFERMRTCFNRSRIQPGNMVGFKATCSIGSVSTQDALNAFHSSGTSSKATTTGLPRLEELTNLTATPRIMGGSFRYNDEILMMTGDAEIKKKKMKRVEELRKIFEYKTFGDFLITCEILKTDKTSVTNEWDEMLDIHKLFEKSVWFDLFFQCMEEEVPIFENDFIIKCTCDKSAMYTFKMTLEDLREKLLPLDLIVIPSPPSEAILYIFPRFNNIDVPKKIDGESASWKYYWTRDYCVPQIKDTQICGIYGIEKIFFSHENVIDYQGNNFKDLMQVPGIIFESLTSDCIWDIVKYFGIHAAYIFLYEEMTKCLSKQLNPAHIMLLARTMTNEGFLTNVTRNGISNKVGILTKASFETPVENFVQGAVLGLNDDTNSLAASYFLGVLSKFGTQDKNFKLLNKK